MINTMTSAWTIDTQEHTFAADVLDRSTSVPVVVDFWAPWCGPCRVLGPVLERLADEMRGAFVLAKLNVDQNQRLAAQFGVQGIPDVKAFRDRAVVDQFTGALPETQVRAWIKKLVPSPADRLAALAASLEAQQPDAAGEQYRQALALELTHGRSLLGLGRVLLLQGDAQAREVLQRVPAGSPEYATAQALCDLVELFAPTDDLGTQGSAARWRAAAEYARRQQWEGALEQLLAIVQRDRAFRNDGARRAMLAVFALLGEGDRLVATYRQRLASALF